MKEEGRFDFADVADAISDKLVSRHPHVFGNADAKDADAVLRQWAALKREEKKAKGGGESVLEGVPREMPALARADRLTEKASRIGFDWPDAAGARAKVVGGARRSSTRRSRAATATAIEHELGDVLFALANLSRKLGVPPEEALRGTRGAVRHAVHARRAGAGAPRGPARGGDPRRDGRALGRGEIAGASSENRRVPTLRRALHTSLGKDRG